MNQICDVASELPVQQAEDYRRNLAFIRYELSKSPEEQSSSDVCSLFNRLNERLRKNSKNINSEKVLAYWASRSTSCRLLDRDLKNYINGWAYDRKNWANESKSGYFNPRRSDFDNWIMALDHLIYSVYNCAISSNTIELLKRL